MLLIDKVNTFYKWHQFRLTDSITQVMICHDTRGAYCDIEGTTLYLGDVIHALSDGNDMNDADVLWFCNSAYTVRGMQGVRIGGRGMWGRRGECGGGEGNVGAD